MPRPFPSCFNPSHQTIPRSPPPACLNYTVTNQQHSAKGLSSSSYLFIPAHQQFPGVPLVVGVTTRNANYSASFLVTVTSSDYTAQLYSGAAGSGDGAWLMLHQGTRASACACVYFACVHPACVCD